MAHFEQPKFLPYCVKALVDYWQSFIENLRTENQIAVTSKYKVVGRTLSVFCPFSLLVELYVMIYRMSTSFCLASIYMSEYSLK